MEAGADAAPPAVRLYVGDDLGYLKVVDAPTAAGGPPSRVVARWGEASRASRSVTALCVADCEAGGPLLGVGRVSGSAEVLAGESGRLLHTSAATPPPAGPDAVAGVHFLPGEGSSAGELLRLLTVARSGLLSLAAATAEAPAAASAVQWQTKANVLGTALHAGEGRLALACQGSEASVWDLGGQCAAWQGKCNKPNSVGLTDLPHNTAVAFVGDGGHELVVGTMKGKLRLYDTRAQRRPCRTLQPGTPAITALAASPHPGGGVWAANAKGDCWQWDLRASRAAGGVKGPAGALRGLALHPALPLLATVGLDRHLRLYSTATRKPLARLYLKQFLNGVAFAPGELARGGEAAGLQILEGAAPVVAGAKRRRED